MESGGKRINHGRHGGRDCPAPGGPFRGLSYQVARAEKFLLELVFTDADVRRFYRTRRRQLDTMAELRAKIGAPRRRREDDTIHLFTTERTFDAIAQGELRDLGLDRGKVLEAMRQKVVSILS
jgi:hypothetical protein